MTGTRTQGNCFANNQIDSVAAQGQSVIAGNSAFASATASAGVAPAIANCMTIGTDFNAWRYFHNPDKRQFSGSEFHMDASTVIDVTTADPVFARVSRAYAAAVKWTGIAASAQASAQTSAQASAEASASYGGSNWVQTTQTMAPAISGLIGTPVSSMAASSASAQSLGGSAGSSANASATSGASSGATGSATSGASSSGMNHSSGAEAAASASAQSATADAQAAAQTAANNWWFSHPSYKWMLNGK